MKTTTGHTDQPHCDCFRIPHAFYCITVSPPLVPGYWDTADGKADLAEQARWDRIERQNNR